MSKGVGIESILRRYLERYSDIKTITLCTTEGIQLTSGSLSLSFFLPFSLTFSLSLLLDFLLVVNRQYWDGNGSYHSVPSFIVSYDQVRLTLFLSLSRSHLFSELFCLKDFSIEYGKYRSFNNLEGWKYHCSIQIRFNSCCHFI